jgi:hypothetical protein
MSTGRAGRASVLTSACLRASGASPRHSAISETMESPDRYELFAARSITPLAGCARSSKRAVRLISGIALDQCRDPERYRTRVPFLKIEIRKSKIENLIAGVVQQQNPASPWLRYRCNSVHPLQFRGHSSASQSGCVTCIRSEVQIFLPSPFYPHSSKHRAGAS